MTKTDLRSRQLNIYMMASSSLITMAPVKELGHNGTLMGVTGTFCFRLLIRNKKVAC